MRSGELFEERVKNAMNSTNLEYIKIIGLFGRHDVELRFDKEVNIYIGENGLGKTTILNCVYYILKKQYMKLAEIDFSEIMVKFSKEEKERVISAADINEYNAERLPRRGFYEREYLDYVIQDLIRSSSDFELIDDNAIEMVSRRISRNTGMPFTMARRQVLEYVKTGAVTSWKKEKKGDSKKIESLNNYIETKFLHKILYFTTYRRIEDDFSKLLGNEEKSREDEMLIRFGMADVEKSIKVMLNQIGENSRESFNKMTGVLLKQYAASDKMKRSFNKSKSIDKSMLKIILDRLGNEIAEQDRNNIISLLDSDKVYNEEFSYLLDLILKLIDNYDKQKVFDDKVKNFANTCNKYLKGKKFVYNQSELTLPVYLFSDQNEQGDTIELTKLSSGEKQIVSLFSKLYLDNAKDSILIIDEPELSLSIEWQRMLLPDIMRSGNCKLLLTVTHSPFIFDNEFDYDAKEIRTCITPSSRRQL